MAAALTLATATLGAAPALATTRQPAPSPSTRVPVAADTGHAAHAVRLRATAAGTPIALAVTLHPGDAAGLARFNAQVSDPSSAQYRHFLTAPQYNARFAPTLAQTGQVEDFLRAQGLRVTGVAGNRQVVDAVGSTAQVAAAFGTGFSDYRSPDGHVYYAADRPASVPSGVAKLIGYVAGLTDRPVARHAPVAKAPRLPSRPASRPAGDGPNGGESPADLQTAYSISSNSGSGRTAGLVQFDGFKQSDITAFTKQYNLPSITPAVVPVDGGMPNPGSGQIEVTLDIDSVAVYAPNAAQVVYEAPNTDQAWTDEWAKIASDNKVDTLSSSWLLGEACAGGLLAGTHDSISQMVAQGVTVLSASGDWGAYGCEWNGDSTTLTADYPASDPNVTGVGGTHLQTGSGGSYQSESVWNSGSSGSTRSGGGYSSTYSTPSWQSAVNSGQYRSVPDVALAADPNSGGLSIVLNGGWTTVGGTSESSPLWSGFILDAVQKAGKRLGAINPTIYATAGSSSYGADFHDVTQGTNGYYKAGPGYDLATGWGSPVGDKLITALTGGTTPPPTNDFSIALDPASGTVTPGQSTSTTVTTKVTSGSAENITLSASGLPPGATASFDPTSINGGGTSKLTITTTGTTAAGTYNVSVTGSDKDATHAAGYTLTVQGGGGGDDITNGGFENGLTGWTTTGTVSVVGSPAHSGGHAAKIGPGNAGLSQTFTAHKPTLSLYYQQACSGSNPFGFTTITLTDNKTGARQYLAQRFCGDQGASGYAHAGGALTNGDGYTISIDNQDFSFQGTKAIYLDDVTTQ